MNKKHLGKKGEDFAAGILEEEGYRILERNFRCPIGEIDLIAEKDGELTFIEVKTRRTMKFGIPAEAVTREKQRRIRAAAEWYLKNCSAAYIKVQFQVVEILYRSIAYAF